MAPILIVAGDPDLRTLLRMLLRRQYALTEVTSAKAALALLRASADPFVVILSSALTTTGEQSLLLHRDQDPELARHAFMLLTADPEGLSQDTRWRLAQLQIPIIAVPFELDGLLQEVGAIQARMAESAGDGRSASGA